MVRGEAPRTVFDDGSLYMPHDDSGRGTHAEALVASGFGHALSRTCSILDSGVGWSSDLLSFTVSPWYLFSVLAIS